MILKSEIKMIGRLIFILLLFQGRLSLSQEIVIIDLGHDDRLEVGTELKIIGIDVLYVTDSLSLDTVLVKAIKESGNVVMAAKLHNLDMPYPFWDSLELPNDKFDSKSIGFSNIYTEGDLVIPEIPIHESYKGKLLQSFSYEIARRSDAKLQSENQRSIKIKRVRQCDCKVVLGRDILKGAYSEKDFKDKIVLFGFSGELYDIKRRSRKTISGVQIQAYFIEYLIRNP
jgi:CHASE2 domain-containing sensor protein